MEQHDLWGRRAHAVADSQQWWQNARVEHPRQRGECQRGTPQACAAPPPRHHGEGDAPEHRQREVDDHAAGDRQALCPRAVTERDAEQAPAGDCEGRGRAVAGERRATGEHAAGGRGRDDARLDAGAEPGDLGHHERVLLHARKETSVGVRLKTRRVTHRGTHHCTRRVGPRPRTNERARQRSILRAMTAPHAEQSTRILVIEDRAEIRDLVRRALREAGFHASEAVDGESGLAAALDQSPDLIVLDLGLPGRDGLEVARDLRARGVRVPLLMLTARVRVAERVEGLDAGADDYLVKPFDVDELVARVRALLRRAALRADDVRLRIGDLVVDPIAREAARGDRRLALTQKEYALLECLARHAGRALTREQIAAQAWRAMQEPAGNVVDVYVSYLRAKLHAPGEHELLHTVRGVGYMLRDGGRDGGGDTTSAA